MKILTVLGLLFFTLSCNNSADTTQTTEEQTPINTIITKSDVEALNYTDFTLDAKANKEITNWMKYYEMEGVISNVKQADVSFFKNNKEILEALIGDLKSTLPEKFNTPLVQARLLALETMLYKLEGVVNLSNIKKEDALLAVKELLISFSNLNLQMNKQIERESQNIQKP